MPDLAPHRRTSLAHPMPRLLLAGLVAILGDNLFNGRYLGISVALFAAFLAAIALATSHRRVGKRGMALSLLLLVAGLAPVAVDVTWLSLGFAVLGLTLSILAWTGGLGHGFNAAVAWACDLLVAGPIRFPDDVARDRRVIASLRGWLRYRAVLLGWVIPLVLCAVFSLLLISANPVIDAWLSDIHWSATPPHLDLGRVILWYALLTVGWVFVGVRLRRRIVGVSFGKPRTDASPSLTSRLLDVATVRRCLALFNLLFAVQTVLDIVYLWAGVALPAGMTYARYAHQGAYPLMVTALLAAAFTLAALRPGSEGERDGTIRGLVGLWVIQNVLMVVSAMLRLDLYVETYSLTYPRVAAFVWMGLVAVGLCLILARIVLHRSNAWLVGANACVLVATLYACAFVSFPALVAGFNLDRDRLQSSKVRFDAHYAMSLGAEAIPALDSYLEDGTKTPPFQYLVWRTNMSDREIARSADWRAWTVRGQGLKDYFERNRITKLTPAPAMRTWPEPARTTP